MTPFSQSTAHAYLRDLVGATESFSASGEFAAWRAAQRAAARLPGYDLAAAIRALCPAVAAGMAPPEDVARAREAALALIAAAGCTIAPMEGAVGDLLHGENEGTRLKIHYRLAEYSPVEEVTTLVHLLVDRRLQAGALNLTPITPANAEEWPEVAGLAARVAERTRRAAVDAVAYVWGRAYGLDNRNSARRIAATKLDVAFPPPDVILSVVARLHAETHAATGGRLGAPDAAGACGQTPQPHLPCELARALAAHQCFGAVLAEALGQVLATLPPEQSAQRTYLTRLRNGLVATHAAIRALVDGTPGRGTAGGD